MLGAPANTLPERLGHAILEVVAARAGCDVLQPHTDYTSIDAIIKPISGSPGGQIDVQIKGDTGLARDRKFIKFPLKIKNYNDLRNTNVIIPRMLVIADLPDEEDELVKVSPSEIIIHRSIYWLDLHAMPATKNSTSITVNIPRSNILSPDQLAKLMSAGYDNVKNGKGGLS